ncbi:MAG: IS110 family transposase [Candidatus Methylomirabilales bacterium]
MGRIEANTVIGMDVGKQYSWCEARSTAAGEVLKEARLPNRPEDFQAFAEDLPRPIRLVMEATGNWQYLYECWEELAEDIQMAHPLKTKAIASARIKTDRLDKGILAHLGLADLVPQAYIPSRDIRDLREVLRHRAFMVALQTRLKNRIHSSLGKLGIDTAYTDLFGKAGLAWLTTLDLREPFRTLLHQDLRILEVLREEIKQATRTIEAMAEDDPQAALILPIRGIGPYSALLILAEIGDIARFPDPKKVVSFAGLCPSTFQSGKVCYHGRITKQGSKWLRWILVEAAQRYARAPGRLGTLYRRIARKKGSKTARTAVARELLVAIYHCLTKGVAFQESPKRGERNAASHHAPLISGR